MAAPNEDQTRGPDRTCGSCGAPFGGDQRYCVECGARRGALPPAIASRIAELLRRDRGEEESDGEAEPAPAPVPAASSGWMPSPRVAAAAVLGMLALGVLLGSATSQIAQSAGLSSILLEVSPPPAEEEEEAEAVEPEETAEPEETTAAASSFPEEAAPEAPAPEEPAEEKEELVPFDPEEEAEETLPPVKHVFLIVLGENSFEETFGATSTAPYLAKELTAQGELLSNYYAVTHGDLANQIALISGQGPTLETAANCPNYADVAPGTVSAEGQVEGNGCVYPAETKTLPNQLAEKKLKWKAYVEDIGNGAASGQPATCRHPAIGTPDLSQVPVPGDAYETWRNPFVYFHSITDGTECAERDVGLDRLAADLKEKVGKNTPALSYIVPNACHDGGELPCEPGLVGGPVEAEETLKTIVPEILESPAYEEGGLIAITSSQALQAGEKADASACCVYPAYPNVPPLEAVEGTTPGTKASGGGGRVGMLLLSPFVKPGSVNETNYDHFTLLLTIEELFELEKLGYANEAALLPFDSTVFNYGEEEESTVAERTGRRGRAALGRAVGW